MLDQQGMEPVMVDPAACERLVEAAMGTAELGLEAQRRHRANAAGGAHQRVGELEQGVGPTGEAAIDVAAEAAQHVDQHAR